MPAGIRANRPSSNAGRSGDDNSVGGRETRRATPGVNKRAAFAIHEALLLAGSESYRRQRDSSSPVRESVESGSVGCAQKIARGSLVSGRSSAKRCRKRNRIAISRSRSTLETYRTSRRATTLLLSSYVKGRLLDQSIRLILHSPGITRDLCVTSAFYTLAWVTFLKNSLPLPPVSSLLSLLLMLLLLLPLSLVSCTARDARMWFIGSHFNR